MIRDNQLIYEFSSRIACNNFLQWTDTMNPWIETEYQRLRHLGFRAIDAIRAARVNSQWIDLENDELVRVRCEPEMECWEDHFDGLLDSPKLKAELARRIDTEGYWIYIVECRLSPDDEWEWVDSIGGIVGDEWHDSGYDIDMKRAAIAKLDEYRQCEADDMQERATYASG